MRTPSWLCTRTAYTLADGRVLSCVMRLNGRQGGEPPPPTYYLGEPHLEPLWWLYGGPQDFGPMIGLDELPHGLDAIAEAMSWPHAYRFCPTVFDPSEPDP
jgi:hypothetical protein